MQALDKFTNLACLNNLFIFEGVHDATRKETALEIRLLLIMMLITLQPIKLKRNSQISFGKKTYKITIRKFSK